MRWRYYDTSDTAESAEHDRVVQQIDAWWKEFLRNTDRLDALFCQAEQWDMPTWMQQHLQAIHPDIMWEFGAALNVKGHRLVITPEMKCELRPLAEEIVARAPLSDRWEFYTYRLPEAAEEALQTIKVRTGLAMQGVTVAVNAGEYNRIDLIYRWQNLPADEEQAFNAAFVATESLLGEKALDRWVGLIQLADAETELDAGKRFLPFDHLQKAFNAVLETTRSNLRSEPYGIPDEDTQWALLKLEPQEAPDYPERSDMLTCVTCDPDLVGATFSEAPFYSERYSRCGETFCYLKIDGSNADATSFHDREDMEEAARNALESQEYGGLIGSGTGLRYTYIELAITDLDAGIPAVRRAMQEGSVPSRSWILFHDADLDAEWIGIYDHSPPPPFAEVVD